MPSSPFVCTLPSDIRTNRPRVDPGSYLPLQATVRVPIYGRVRQSRLQVRRTHAHQISKCRSPRLQLPLPAPIRRLCECVYECMCMVWGTSVHMGEGICRYVDVRSRMRLFNAIFACANLIGLHTYNHVSTPTHTLNTSSEKRCNSNHNKKRSKIQKAKKN